MDVQPRGDTRRTNSYAHHHRYQINPLPSHPTSISLSFLISHVFTPGDESYLEVAERIATAAITNLSANGTLQEPCEPTKYDHSSHSFICSTPRFPHLIFLLLPQNLRLSFHASSLLIYFFLLFILFVLFCFHFLQQL